MTTATITGCRVMIVEDHEIVRRSLRALLEQRGCVVVAEAGEAREALEVAPKARPQVILMDLELPGLDGISATRRLRKLLPAAKLLILSAHDEPERVIEALIDAGAHGYLLKSDAPDELFAAIRAVAEGKRYLGPSVTPIFLEHVGGASRDDQGGPRLTPREREVLRLVSQGATSKEIAQELGISPKTAQIHRENLKQKLDLRTTADLVRYAIRHKIARAD
ncbi:MAG TPA: response regulator transcription factor [Candidatus Binataceae bacterium]|jgi:two-component system response regulator NreC|nr:response regulator transcription factor [Candidatus Binataceae bacterium]